MPEPTSRDTPMAFSRASDALDLITCYCAGLLTGATCLRSGLFHWLVLDVH
jgi:hypothetical protein